MTMPLKSILKQGPGVEVLGPATLRKDVAAQLQKALEQY